MRSQYLPPNPISSTVPFDEDGKHHGYLRLPCSRDVSAWGSIMIPITVVHNGAGPTALLTGANHGDEYEGPIALQRLAYDLDPGEITGRVIIVPYMNTPAFHAARRTSPLDGVNLNRCFPGRPDGSPTEKIADYFMRTLLPMADVVLDFHSGGKTLDFIPFAAAHILDDANQQAACSAAMRAFNAPYSMMLREIDAVGMYDTAAEDAGKTFISTELGGGGTATARSARIALRGAINILRHVGILEGELEEEPSVLIDTTEGDCFHLAEGSGMVEMLIDLGEPVAKGATLARIWSAERTGAKPHTVKARMSGILAARHHPGLIQPGDCLAVVAAVVEES
ncbi:MAG: N-alpha-acetyl diaminobutyric acid deacetylase DoeB [Geminicoccaceae bacterium]|jgi:N-alpha-acetyl-L-2,4-diaminobutyrate deacetylase|nr:N-alpha-acetyl diaminobutyric acid deacetylase DoeB [Geminicoccaceae bacterium]HRY25912.1 N(2)-acetyl-L-2,4-diaminobutanoate deacetylase DoeB [Geminicoccaceae bacterium]